jgi:predicted O-linked N-acetylglucosamine transferase (SPINDLY family)
MNATDKARRLVEQANALITSGRHQAALAKLEEAARLLPGHPGVLNNLGVVLEKLGRLEAALDKYEQVRRSTPPHPGLLNNCAVVLRKLGRGPEALERFDQALALRPDYAEALANRGKLLVEQLGRPGDGLASLDRSLALRPDHADTWSNHAVALRALDRSGAALASADRALAIDPRHPDALHNRAGLLEDLRRFDEAALAWGRVLAVDPQTPYARGRLFGARLQVCDWTDYDSTKAEIESGIEEGERREEPWHLLAYSSSLALQKRCARIFVEDRFPAAIRPLWKGERYTHDRIRIAWLSGGFHEGVESQVFVEFLERQDRTRFETYGVSTGDRDETLSGARMVAAFEHFFDAKGLSDLEVAQWLRAQEIDIVVVLTAYMSGSRAGILAHRPVPLQVNFAYPGPMGASYVDYVVADAKTLPPDREHHYSEKVLRLPLPFMSYYAPDNGVDAVPSRASVGLPEQGFVFCCFNTNYKFQPDVFDIWMRLLRAVGGAVLWLRASDQAAIANLRAEAERRGVDPERIVFAPRVSHDAHLARYAAADLFVDAYPYAAHTTACEALGAGLPVLTMSGESFVSCISSGLVEALGLTELVVDNLRDYEARALELSTTPGVLAEIRQKLRRNREAAPVFVPERFCRYLETGLISMHERHRRGETAATIDVPA